jgi:hypothetical protein
MAEPRQYPLFRMAMLSRGSGLLSRRQGIARVDSSSFLHFLSFSWSCNDGEFWTMRRVCKNTVEQTSTVALREE